MNGLGAALELLRTPHVGPFLGGRACAAVGIWMERIGLGWLAWEATGSASWVGAMAFVRLAPAIVFGPWGGVIADRIGAIRVLKASYFVATILSLTIAILVTIGSIGVWPLLILGAASGILQSISNGPMKSAVSDVSPRHLLATAVPVSSVTFNLAAFVGPSLAGLILAGAGAALLFVVAAVGSGVFVLVLARQPRAIREGAHHARALHAFTDAIGESARDPVIAPLMMMHIVFALLVRPLIDLLPAVVGGLFDGGPQDLGLLTGAMGLGALGGSLWLTWRSTSAGLKLRVLGAAFMSCIAAVLFAFSGSVSAAAIMMLFLGAAMVVRAAGSNTIVQLQVKEDYRARVMSIWGTVLRLGAAIGGLGLGLAGDIFGLKAVIVLAAVVAALTIVPVAIGLRRSSGF